MKKFRFILVVLAVAGLLAVPVGVASADPGEPTNASCMGIEASAISPPGSSDEAGAEQGMPGVVRLVREGFGIRFGEFAKLFAHAHHGTHEACDAELLPSG